MPQALTTGNLSDAQLANVARQGGFPDSEIPLAVAIAKAESSGNPRAHNTNASTGDNSYGLWQINMIGAMGPDRRKALGLTSNDQLFDPVVNAKAAYFIRKRQGWSAWSTYKKVSQQDPSAVGEAPLDGSGATAGIGEVVAGPITSGIAEKIIGGEINKFTEKTRQALITYMIFAVALVLLILGVVILNRQNVGKIASLIPAGRIAKVAGAIK